ncbi:26S proteasome non-ATPase regulatory subunit [Mitosporidium daphniae]
MVGLIHAVRGSYHVAADLLNESVRRGPQSSSVAIGFQQSVQKLLVVVLLLAGELPERSLFEKSTILEQSLQPYFIVRKGDISLFEQTMSKFRLNYEKDKLIDLVVRYCQAFFTFRLRNCVIRAGLRLVSLAYSRISLGDIALKLHINSEKEQLEFLIVQAISDGILKGNIEDGVLLTQPTSNVYATSEPQKTLASRTVFCLKAKGSAQSALRYPQETYTEGLMATQLSSIGDKEGDNGANPSKGGKSKSSQKDSDINSENDEDEDSMILGADDAADDDGFDSQDFI